MRFRGQCRCYERSRLCPPPSLPPLLQDPQTQPLPWTGDREQRGWALGAVAKPGGGTGACREQRGAAGSWGGRKREWRRQEQAGVGGTQACSEEFRIAASLHPPPHRHSRAVWAWNLSRHRGMRWGKAGGHRAAGGDPHLGVSWQQGLSTLRTPPPAMVPGTAGAAVLPAPPISRGAPGTPPTHPNRAR